jgi:hypothetical protein
VKPAHLHQLEAWTQEELHAQREYARSLESYERAVVRGDLAALPPAPPSSTRSSRARAPAMPAAARCSARSRAICEWHAAR